MRAAASPPSPSAWAVRAGRVHSRLAMASAKNAPSPSSMPPYMARSSVVPIAEVGFTSMRLNICLGRARHATPNPANPTAAVPRAIRDRVMRIPMCSARARVAGGTRRSGAASWRRWSLSRSGCRARKYAAKPLRSWPANNHQSVLGCTSTSWHFHSMKSSASKTAA